MGRLLYQMLHTHSSLEALLFLFFVILGTIVAYAIASYYEDDSISESLYNLKKMYLLQIGRKKWEL